MQGRLEFTMDDIMRRSMKNDPTLMTTTSTPRQSNKLKSQSIDFRSTDFSSPMSIKSFTADPMTDKKLQMGLTSLSWTQSKNFIEIPKMIERVPGEYFIGKYQTQAMYELPTCIGEDMGKIPRFHKMSGRYRRLHGNLLRNMTVL